MNSHTPAPPRIRSRRLRDPSRVIIANNGEDYPDDAPTVMASDLTELGIEPDSLALPPDRARIALRARARRHSHVSTTRDVRAPMPVTRTAAQPSKVALPESPSPTEPQPSAPQHDDRMQLALVIGLASLPVVIALVAAAWLTFG